MMFSFLKESSETQLRNIYTLFDYLAQIDLLKTPGNRLRNMTLLYIATLRELMNQIEKRKSLFRIPSVVACADMITNLIKYFSFSNDQSINLFHLILSDEPIIINFTEDDVTSYSKRKLRKIHNLAVVLGYAYRHHPEVDNIKDVFIYSFILGMERLNLLNIIPVCMPQISPDEYTFIQPPEINIDNISTKYLLNLSQNLEPPFDPLLMLFVRFAFKKLFGDFDFKQSFVPDLINIILSFVEEDPTFKIDDLINLLVYYSSSSINFPIHLAFTEVNHCLFFIGMTLCDLIEPTDNDILLTTISTDYAPYPSLSLILAQNLYSPILSNFISQVKDQKIPEEWDNEIKFLLQFIKAKTKIEELVENAKNCSNLDSINKLLTDPSCLPLLEPNEYQSHKLLSIFLNNNPNIPEKIDFDLFGVASIFHLMMLKAPINVEILSKYIIEIFKQVEKLTLKICQDKKYYFHAVFSNIKPPNIELPPKNIHHGFRTYESFFIQLKKDLTITQQLSINKQDITHNSSESNVENHDNVVNNDKNNNGTNNENSNDTNNENSNENNNENSNENNNENSNENNNGNENHIVTNTISDSLKLEYFSVIIDSIIVMFSRLDPRPKYEKNFLKYITDLELNYLLCVDHDTKTNDTLIKAFGKVFQTFLKRRQMKRFFNTFHFKDYGIEHSIELFKPVLVNINSNDTKVYLIKNLMAKVDDDVTAKVIHLTNGVTANIISSFKNHELFHLIKVFIDHGMPRDAAKFIPKLMTDDPDNIYPLLLEKSFSNPNTIKSILNNLPKIGNFVKYFFENCHSLLSDSISTDFASLLSTLFTFLKESDFEFPIYPKLKAIDTFWSEDKQLSRLNRSKGLNRTANDGFDVNIDEFLEENYMDDDDEEEEEEEIDLDLYFDDIEIYRPSLGLQNYKFKTSTEEKPSIWEKPLLKHCTFIDTGPHFIKQPFFKCLTCNFSSDEGVCEFCALNCHKGHKLVFDSEGSCYCDCYSVASRCISNPNHNQAHNHNHQEPKTNNQEDEITSINHNQEKINVSIDTKTTMRLFKKLSSAKYCEAELNGSKLKQLPSVKCANQFQLTAAFSPYACPSLLQLKKKSARMKITSQQLDRKTNYIPLNLICKVGNENKICYANGECLYLTSFGETGKGFESAHDHFIFSLTSHNNLIAAISDQCIYVLAHNENSTNNNGNINEINNANPNYNTNPGNSEESKLEYLCKLVPPSIPRIFYYIDAKFLNNDQIVTLTNSSIIVWEISTQKMISSYDAEKLCSLVIFKYNDDDFILTSNMEGELFVYSLSNRIIKLSHLVAIDKFRCKTLVSYCESDNLIFISSEKTKMMCCELNDLFISSPQLITIDNFTSLAVFTGKYPGKDQIYMFANPKTGNITSVEITSKQFIVSNMSDLCPTGNIPLIDFMPIYFGSLVFDDSFYVVSPDGIFMKVYLNDNRKIICTIPDSVEEEVPITFWSRSKVNPSEVKLILNDSEEMGSLLTGNTLAVPPNSTLKFTARLTNSLYSIVGIRVFAVLPSLHNTRMVEFNERFYPFNSTTPTCIPFRPDEVKPGASATFKVLPNNEMMILRLINIHCVKTDELTIPPITIVSDPFNWMTDCLNIFDFNLDALKDIPTTPKSKIVFDLAKCFEDDGSVTQEEISNLIRLMYECPDLSLQCRLILLKTKIDQNLKLQIWSEAIKDTLKQNKVHESLTKVFWRDFSLLDQKYKADINYDVWQNVPNFDGVSCFVSAFH